MPVLTAGLPGIGVKLPVGGLVSSVIFKSPDGRFHPAGWILSILGAMLVVYRSGAIAVTDNFKIGVVSATGGIAVFYLVALVSQWMGGSLGAPLINGSGLYGIAFSVIVIGVAALNFVLDFDLIEKGAAAGAPQYGVVRGVRPDAHTAAARSLCRYYGTARGRLDVLGDARHFHPSFSRPAARRDLGVDLLDRHHKGAVLCHHHCPSGVL